jgi:hypothetical protein
MSNNTEIKKLAEKIIALCGADAPSAAKAALPTPKELKKLDDKAAAKLAKALGINVGDGDAKALIATAIAVTTGEGEVESDDIVALGEAIGVDVNAKKPEKSVPALAAYFAAEEEAEEAADEDEDEEAEEEDEVLLSCRCLHPPTTTSSVWSQVLRGEREGSSRAP